MLGDSFRALYERHKTYRGHAKGLMINEEWRYTGRLGVAIGALALLNPRNILDVGCGYADLGAALPDKITYTGIDYTSWVVDEARARHPALDIRKQSLEGENSLPVADCVSALGVLATVPKQDLTRTLDLLRGLSRRYLLISYLDPEVYDGRLHAHSYADLCPVLGAMVMPPVAAPGDEINKTAIFAI